MNFYEKKQQEREQLVGKTFERLYILSINKVGLHWKAECICSCGNTISTRISCLKRGETRSCGCLSREETSKRQTTHGLTSHRMHSRWVDINRRCYNRKRSDYKHYGGRGITVCDRWLSSNPEGLNNFIEDMDNSYFDGAELERKDVNGNYSPENCTWVTRRAQTNNLRRNNRQTYKAYTMTIAEWSIMTGISSRVLGDRLNKLKWSIDRALTFPVRSESSYYLHRKTDKKFKTMQECLDYVDLKWNSFYKTAKEQGLSPEEYMKELGIDIVPSDEQEKRMVKILRFMEGEDLADFSKEAYEIRQKYCG